MARLRKSTNTQKATESLVEVVLEQATQPVSSPITEVIEATVEAPIVETPTIEETEETVKEPVNTGVIIIPETSQEELVAPTMSAPTVSAAPTSLQPVATISVAEACTQLAMPEQMFRLALQPSYPHDFDTLKELPLEEFKVIAETLQYKALGGGERHQEQPQPTQEGQPQQLTNSNLAPTQSSIPTDQRQKLETGTNNALALFAGEYVLTLDKITSALAYTSSKASLNNFVTIHSNVFRDGLENYLEEFADEMTTAAHAISQVSAKDFLYNRGITPKDRRASKAIDEILKLAPNV